MNTIEAIIPSHAKREPEMEDRVPLRIMLSLLASDKERKTEFGI
jgi:hypothetical protein